MAKQFVIKAVALFSLFISIVVIEGCAPFSSEEQLYKWAYRESLSKNTLVHISISKPKEWRLGADKNLQIMEDYPLAVGELSDYAVDYSAFTHATSRSSIFVSYKPIVGRSYFVEDPQKVAEWFKAVHLEVYKKYKIEVLDGSVKFYTMEIGGRSFYVIQNEILTHLKEKREIYIFFNVSEDMKSLYLFCFSTPSKEGSIEKNQPFQDFISIMKEFKINRLEPYDQILYRNSRKLWMLSMYSDSRLYNAIDDESIEELKNAAALKPNRWEPHYLLAEIYSSYVNANAAIDEYKYLIKINPNFRDISKWMPLEQSSPTLGEIYRHLARIFFNAGKNDEAISYLEEGIKKVPSSDSSYSSLREDLRRAYLERAERNAK